MEYGGASVLDSIVDGVKADLAVREAEVDFAEIKRRGAAGSSVRCSRWRAEQCCSRARCLG